MKHLPYFLIFFILIPLYLMGNPVLPKNPILPKNPNQQFNTSIKNSRKAIVIYKSGLKKFGTLQYLFSHIPCVQNKKKQSLKITSIYKIFILQWKKQKIKNNTYIFFPVKFKITYKNRKVFICNSRIKSLERLTFYTKKRKRYIYTFFYDYWMKDRWSNSQSKDASYPEKNPHDRTVVSIIFL